MLNYQEIMHQWSNYHKEAAATTDDIELCKWLYQEYIKDLENYIKKLEAAKQKNFE